MLKKIALEALTVALSLLLIPAAVKGIEERKNKKPAAQPEQMSESKTPAEQKEESIAVFLPETDETKTLSMRDYVIGCVAAEMPAVYEDEALRAQAAASATLARYMQANNRNNKTLKGGVIAADPGSYQGYYTKEEMKKHWGEGYEDYYEKIAAAVDETLPYTITCDGAPILAAFHAVSAGVTENAETVWDKKLPYLVSVPSDGDKLCPGYASSVTVTAEELKEKLGLSPDGKEAGDWLGEAEYSAAGTLLSQEICGKKVSGATLRDRFSLRSAAVQVGFDGDGFVLDVKGYGHGVGMSQYGADYYARQGLTWREILAHYYPGTVLQKQ